MLLLFVQTVAVNTAVAVNTVIIVCEHCCCELNTVAVNTGVAV